MSHLALVLPTLDRIGGAERQALLLAKGMQRRGWRVSVVALSGAGVNAAANLIAEGPTFLSLEMRKGLADPRGWMRFHRWLTEARPDVVHAHLPHAVWLARWSRLGAPVRAMVDTLHSSSTGTMGRRLGYRASDWLTDRVTAVSHAVAKAHLSAGMAGIDKLMVLPNGVDVQAWRPDTHVRNAMRREALLDGEFLWLAAGRLEPVKDYPTLLAAMARAPQPSRLIVAGCGPLKDELLRLTAQLGLESRVRFLGFEEDLRPWMQAADGFVLSSHWEGLPIALLEAAACAVPAVATDVPGTREALLQGQTGFLAQAGDAPSLCQAMTAVMRLPLAERRAMGEQARQAVTERYSLKVVLDRWEALYQELLGQNPRPLRWGKSA